MEVGIVQEEQYNGKKDMTYWYSLSMVLGSKRDWSEFPTHGFECLSMNCYY